MLLKLNYITTFKNSVIVKIIRNITLLPYSLTNKTRLMKLYKVILLITFICITPLLIMSTNSIINTHNNAKMTQNTTAITTPNSSSSREHALDLKIGDIYFDIKVKVPHYKVSKNMNNNVVLISKKAVITLDAVAHKKTNKYTVSNTAKITNIVIEN